MKYGVCCNPELAPGARQAGFAFLEFAVGAILEPQEGPESFSKALQQAKAACLPYEALNCFIPAELKITGPEGNLATLETYVTTTFHRAQEAKIAVIVFGSGGARQIPDGFDPAKAHAQIVAFCRMLAPIAMECGVTVAVEPLNRKECNVLNSVRECAALVREVGHPALRLLVDSYHLMKDQDSLEDVIANGKLLAHVHISTVPQRVAPGAEPCDLFPFFDALVRAGYDGRVSIEATITNPTITLPNAFAYMNKLEREAKTRKTAAKPVSNR